MTKLAIAFEPVAGGFEATLPNGAKFHVAIEEVRGKLRTNLELFAKGAAAQAKPKRQLSEDEEKAVTHFFMQGGLVQKVGVEKAPSKREIDDLSLEDLELDL